MVLIVIIINLVKFIFSYFQFSGYLIFCHIMMNQITSNYSKISNLSQNKPILSQAINQIMSDDVYTRLGVSRNSSIDIIKKAYKRRALLVHPDKCHFPNADDLFKRLKNA